MMRFLQAFSTGMVADIVSLKKNFIIFGKFVSDHPKIVWENIDKHLHTVLNLFLLLSGYHIIYFMFTFHTLMLICKIRNVKIITPDC